MDIPAYSELIDEEIRVLTGCDRSYIEAKAKLRLLGTTPRQVFDFIYRQRLREKQREAAMFPN